MLRNKCLFVTLNLSFSNVTVMRFDSIYRGPMNLSLISLYSALFVFVWWNCFDNVLILPFVYFKHSAGTIPTETTMAREQKNFSASLMGGDFSWIRIGHVSATKAALKRITVAVVITSDSDRTESGAPFAQR